MCIFYTLKKVETPKKLHKKKTLSFLKDFIRKQARESLLGGHFCGKEHERLGGKEKME